MSIYQEVHLKTISHGPITKKMLLETLQKFYKNDEEKAGEVASFILESREESVKETIKRKKD